MISCGGASGSHAAPPESGKSQSACSHTFARYAYATSRRYIFLDLGSSFLNHSFGFCGMPSHHWLHVRSAASLCNAETADELVFVCFQKDH